MSIIVTGHDFNLQTTHTSYLMGVLENGEMGQYYYGPRLGDKVNFADFRHREFRSITPTLTAEQPEITLSMIKQEYPSYGHGDFRYPAYQVTYDNGARISEFTYQDYEIIDGKPKLGTLPSASADVDDKHVQTLRIHLLEQQSGLKMTLNYSVFEDEDVIVRSTTFENKGTSTVKLDAALSASVDFSDDQYDMIQLSGAWARERHLYRRPLTRGVQAISSTRDASSAQQSPFLALARKQTTDQNGDVYGFNLVYSGNFLAQVEVDSYNVTRMTMGINPFEFGWQLKSHTQFQTPEVMMTFASDGFNGMSHQFQRFLTNHLISKRWVKEPRPILINNWEATYFDFNEQKLLAIAKSAKSLGIELFVLDDGWFGKRNDDKTSLGDWQVNLAKLPNGLSGLANKIHDLGLQFGLWFEPEMISKESKLYAAHPDWNIHVPDRRMTPARNQFVLDFSRQEVIDYLFDQMAAAIRKTHLDYIKWDMNRHITEMFSLALSADQQEELPHRYILGVYQLYERLTSAFPDVLFESCSSGGGRFDAGMLYYAPQTWTSDDTDAIERLKIQWGTSMIYPLSTMGAHVSAVPNHQDRRVTSLATRAEVAYFGVLGYELDISKMSPAEKATVVDQIKFYKKYRLLFQQGTFIRLQSPYDGDGNVTSWMVVSDDQRTAIAGRYQVLAEPNPAYRRLKFAGLNPDFQYTVDGVEGEFSGRQLMNAGIFIPELFAERGDNRDQTFDFHADLYVVHAK